MKKKKSNPFAKLNTKSPTKKTSSKPAPARSLNLPPGWYLMLQPEVGVEELQTVLKSDLYDTEIWKDAGVLEVILKEKCSLDLELCPLDMQDEYSNNFLAEREIHSLFYASFPESGYEEAKTALLHILHAFQGLVCGDTDDFMPRMEA